MAFVQGAGGEEVTGVRINGGEQPPDEELFNYRATISVFLILFAADTIASYFIFVLFFAGKALLENIS